MAHGATGRVLVVADDWPWPSDTGYRQRLRHVVQALSAASEVDYLACLAQPPARPEEPGWGLLSGEAFRVSAPWRAGLGNRAGWWLRTGAPWPVSSRDWSAARAMLRQLVHRDYDLVWLGHCDTLLALGDLLPVPKVVDVDNVQSGVSASRRRAWRPSWGTADSLRCVIDVVDEGRWRRVERRLDRLTDAVVVCSPLDQQRLPWFPTSVVPNGYEPPVRCRRPAASDVRVPTLTMVGTMGYEPNLDGARWFAHHVLPLVATRVPAVRFLVVGSTGGHAEIAELGRRPGVEVTGHVDDVAPYLADTDVVVAPIRFGGGTRVKVLEGFACHLPVVSTTLGCEGLDVVAGSHLLVADTPANFADACVRLLSEPLLAEGVAAAAHALYASRYRSEVVGQAVTDVVDNLIGTTAEPTTAAG